MKTALLVAVLGGPLAGTVWLGVVLWSGMGDVEISRGGVIALILGVVATIGLAVGLMALVFYSHRSRHDDEAGR